MPPNIPGTLTAQSLRNTTQLWKVSDHKAQKDGVRHTVYWTTGEKYQGEWHDNKRHGRGCIIYKNGDKYEGDWENGKRHGLGTLWFFKDGKYIVRYHGEWAEDIPNGHGTFYDDSGDTYEGSYLTGSKHGKGRAVYGGRPVDGFGGDVYEGFFENDVRHGPGTMMYANGDIYEGTWANNRKHGRGSFYYMSKGKRFDGVWHEDSVKCGSYSEIHAPPPGTVGSLPPCELAHTEAVLSQAINDALQKL